jgi:hypothetical protein
MVVDGMNVLLHDFNFSVSRRSAVVTSRTSTLGMSFMRLWLSYFVSGLSVVSAGVMRHHAAFKNSLSILYTIRLLLSQLGIALSCYVQAL